MNRTQPAVRRVSSRAGSLLALCLPVIVATGCTSEKPFAVINGTTVTQNEYLRTLERQQVQVQGGQPTNAERVVIDQIIGNKVVLKEADKAGVTPTDDQIDNYYKLQQKLFEQQVPGKTYENTMKEAGTTPEEIKSDMKVQLAETALYAKKMNIGEDEVKKAFESQSGQVGLPARVQLRLILTNPGSPEFDQAKQQLASGKDFNEVAKQINPPQLKATGGLVAQATPLATIAPKYQPQVQQLVEGKFFGPIDFQLAPGQPQQKAWIKVERRLPAFNVPYESAAPLVRRALVQQKLQDPANQKVRDEILALKLQAQFQPTDPMHGGVWDAIKKTAQDAGIGKNSGPALPGTTPAGAMPAGAPVAPGPAAKP